MIWAALILGLLGSWHCVGMCGPIALMVPGAQGKNRVFAILLYHGGKIISYILIGLFFGLFTVFIDSFFIQSIITISVGILIGILGILPSVLNYAEKIGFNAFQKLFNLKNKLSQSLKKDNLEYGLYIGFFNGFIPCGLVYVAALGAMIQPDFLSQAGFMLFFGIGTMPFLSLVIFSSSFIKSKLGSLTPKIRTLTFIAMSIFLIYKGAHGLSVELSQPKEGDQFQICAQVH